MKNLFKTRLFILLSLGIISFSCDDNSEDTQPNNDSNLSVPSTYTFTRGGASTVSFSGQTTRIAMASELVSNMSDFDATEIELLEMYRNQTSTNGDANPFSSEELNSSTKSVKSKVAASNDFFGANVTEGLAIKADFETWIQNQVAVVFPSNQTAAKAGTAGQISDGESTRYVNEQGLEYNQLVNKGLIGALMLDQIVNNYLSTDVLDEGDNRAENDNADTLTSGYTTMEHKWDEAYGYLFGATANSADPIPTVGADDAFLNKYLGRVEGDEDFKGIAQDIFDAFIKGRAAIVARNYEVRDEQAEILRKKLSEIIGIRAVYYMQQGKNAMSSNQGGAFHDFSEGYGFLYSLRFTRKPNSSEPYFTKAEVDGFISSLLGDGDNGLWDVKPETLDKISADVAAKFDFSVAQAAE